MLYLFVGGEQDGKFIDLREGQRKAIFIKRESYKFTGDEVSYPIQTRCHETYNKEMFAGEKKRFFIFRLVSLSCDEMIEMLIKNYSPKNT